MRKFQADLGWKKPLVVLAIMLLVVVQFMAAQNLGRLRNSMWRFKERPAHNRKAAS